MRQHRSAVVHPEEPPSDLPAVDETVIEQLASITDGQGFSVLGELLNAFLSAVPGRLEALEREVTAGDLVAVGQQAHALTGSAASFGWPPTTAIATARRASSRLSTPSSSRSEPGW